MKNILLLLFVLTALSGFGQTKSSIPGPLEQKEDNYVPNRYNKQRVSPAYHVRTSGIRTVQANVDAQGNNIIGDAANEPNLCIDPKNPARLAIGWRQFDDISSNFRQAGWAFTADTGHTWNFPGVIDQGVFRSDPVLDYDTLGTFFYNSLSTSNNTYYTRVYRSSDGGTTWDNGVEAMGGDKQWMTIDRTNGVGSGNIYEYWNQYYSYCYPGMFTRSTNHGTSYEACSEIPDSPFWGSLTVDKDGNLYTVGINGMGSNLVVTKSSNAKIPGAAIVWENSSYINLDGFPSGSAVPVNPVGLMGMMYIDSDHSDGPGSGNIYVLSSVIRNNGDPADVMFASSNDGGLTWNDPVQVNDDQSLSNYQWFGTMAVAPNGRIDVVWYDTRDAAAGSDSSALYYSYSVDQGQTFSVNQRMSEKFNPNVGYPNQDKIGDYIDIISDNRGAHLAWSATFNGEQDVYYSYIINDITTGIKTVVPGKYAAVSCYPNPSKENTTLRLQIPAEQMTTVTILDLTGKEIRQVYNGRLNSGIHSMEISTEDLPQGIFIIRMKTGASVVTSRLVKIG
ncbi:MAG: T9SS type A sorting domain-containing protein [Syntrophothermus sp.]